MTVYLHVHANSSQTKARLGGEGMWFSLFLQPTSGGSLGIFWFVIKMAASPALGKYAREGSQLKDYDVGYVWPWGQYLAGSAMELV